MAEIRVATIQNELGLHARAAAQFVQTANKFRADITVEKDGELMFDGQKRGICGDATRTSSLRQTELFSRLIAHRGLSLSLIGVGGASTAEHVRAYLEAGAEQVHIASAAMADPSIAVTIKQSWAECESKEMV